jgi:hypothetical protein
MNFDMSDEARERFKTILELATLDKDFRKRLVENPKMVFDEIGLKYPSGSNLMVIELPENTLPIPLPPLVSGK